MLYWKQFRTYKVSTNSIGDPYLLTLFQLHTIIVLKWLNFFIVTCQFDSDLNRIN